MPANNHPFVDLLYQLRTKALERGDRDLAEAVSQCICHVTGGSPCCPMGEFILSRFIETSRLPNPHLPETPAPTSASPVPAGAPLDRKALFYELLAKAQVEGLWPADLEFLKALAEARATMETNPDCPMHRLLFPDSPTST